MWVIIPQLLLLRLATHRLPGHNSHRHHHYSRPILEASQKGASTLSSNVKLGRNPKLAQSIVLCQNQSTFIERYPTPKVLYVLCHFVFQYRTNNVELVLIPCNSFTFIRMKYIFFKYLRSSKIVEAQKTFLRECRAKIIAKVSLKLQKAVPKGAQCKCCRSYKSRS
jgi:hypothetical protein